MLTWIVGDTGLGGHHCDEFGMQEVFVVLIASGITLLAMAITEVLTKLLKSHFKIGVVATTAGLGLACFLLSGYLCSEFCAVWSVLWTYSFLLGIAFEVLLSQSLRALIKILLTN